MLLNPVAVINRVLVGPITLLNECIFLVPLASREEVKEVRKLRSFRVETKDGPYTLNLARWLVEIGVDSCASREGQWTII